MPSYDFRKEIPSLKLSKGDVESLEQLILRRFSPDQKKERSFNYSVAIGDPSGREKLDSIRDFERDDFPNDTTEVSLELWYIGSELRHVEITFSSDSSTLSRIWIQTEADRPRELATGLYAEIERLIQDRRTAFNRFFHGPLTYSHFTFLGLSLMFFSAVEKTESPFPLYLAVAFLLLIPVWEWLRQTSPYIVFDSAANRRNGKIKGWVFGTLIAGPLITYLYSAVF